MNSKKDIRRSGRVSSVLIITAVCFLFASLAGCSSSLSQSKEMFDTPYVTGDLADFDWSKLPLTTRIG